MNKYFNLLTRTMITAATADRDHFEEVVSNKLAEYFGADDDINEKAVHLIEAFLATAGQDLLMQSVMPDADRLEKKIDLLMEEVKKLQQIK